MVHEVLVASNNNGFGRLASGLLFNTTLHVRHMENIPPGMDEGYAMLRLAAAGKTARGRFVEGDQTCGHDSG
jgi:sn-glycerol 3-phosphate transport system substrate-binding protein